jgi:hypothetical protein
MAADIFNEATEILGEPAWRRAIMVWAVKKRDPSRVSLVENRPKIEHFRNSRNKLGYRYLLTLGGLDTKARIAARFIQRKRLEYDALQAQLEQITAEAQAEGLIDTETASP